MPGIAAAASRETLLIFTATARPHRIVLTASQYSVYFFVDPADKTEIVIACSSFLYRQ
jgi:hypothetical protein